MNRKKYLLNRLRGNSRCCVVLLYLFHEHSFFVLLLYFVIFFVIYKFKQNTIAIKIVKHINKNVSIIFQLCDIVFFYVVLMLEYYVKKNTNAQIIGP